MREKARVFHRKNKRGACSRCRARTRAAIIPPMWSSCSPPTQKGVAGGGGVAEGLEYRSDASYAEATGPSAHRSVLGAGRDDPSMRAPGQ